MKNEDGPENMRKPFNYKILGTMIQYSEILNNSELLRDFLEFLKKTEMPQK